MICRPRSDALYRLLRALTAIDIFCELDGKRFGLATLGHYLRSDTPETRRAWAISAVRPPAWAAWGDLHHSVRTGETAFGHVHGTDVWTFRSSKAEEGANFDDAMREGSQRIGELLLRSFDFSPFHRIVDVGGGDGALLARLLGALPHTRGIVFDLAHVVRRGKLLVENAGLGERCSFLAGSFFDAVPAGADAYLLKSILHDWDDTRSLTILRNCRRAMPPGARLFVIERLLDEADQGAEAAFSDLNMLVNAGGRERNLAQFNNLLGCAELHLRETRLLGSGFSLLTAA